MPHQKSSTWPGTIGDIQAHARRLRVACRTVSFGRLVRGLAPVAAGQVDLARGHLPAHPRPHHCHHPRRRMIQYAVTPPPKPCRLRLLGRPHARTTTGPGYPRNSNNATAATAAQFPVSESKVRDLCDRQIIKLSPGHVERGDGERVRAPKAQDENVLSAATLSYRIGDGLPGRRLRLNAHEHLAERPEIDRLWHSLANVQIQRPSELYHVVANIFV